MASKVRLLRSGRQFARDLRQAGRRERGEADRNAAGGIEEIGQRVGDVLLVDVEAAAVVQREIQVDVVGVVAQRRVQVGRNASNHRVERVHQAADGGQDRVLLGHRAGRNDHDGGAAEGHYAGDLRQIAARARDFDHVARRRR